MSSFAPQPVSSFKSELIRVTCKDQSMDNSLVESLLSSREKKEEQSSEEEMEKFSHNEH